MTTVSEPEVLTEVPDSLKKLVRFVLKGFYPSEHFLAIDMLLHHPCIKEDDLAELLQFEKKQLRTVMNFLKNDKFVKIRMRVETDAEGRTTRHNYYFINYSVLVNVVKYKLDHMRRKIEMEERDATNRASYHCPMCKKTFTDLEADQLFDPMYNTFNCTYCQTEVEEDASYENKTDARTLMMKFNEQLTPLFTLLRDVEDVRLSSKVLEPEPVELEAIRRAGGGGNVAQKSISEHQTWSGDATKNINYGLYGENKVIIDMDGQNQTKVEPAKEKIVWMTESTVKGGTYETATNATVEETRASSASLVSKPSDDDIMKTLLAHEIKKSNTPLLGKQLLLPGSKSESETSSSESEDETSQSTGFQQETTAVNKDVEMESEEEEEEQHMLTVAGQRVHYDDVTEEMIHHMTPTEYQIYMATGRKIYEYFN